MGSSRPGSEVVSVRRFPLRDLEPGAFEELCTYLITMDYRDARRLAPPDRGADAIIALDTGPWVWQFKRMGHTISWPKCVESLDVAVEHYSPSRVTFCFPRDLTASQFAKFKSKLQDRHPTIHVDWWGESYLVSRMLSGPQGERIANSFFENPSETTTRLMAAIRAGSPLETGADIDRVLGAIGAFAAGHDPDFEYRASVREAGSPPPSPPPRLLAGVEISDGVTARRLEAIPRTLQVRRDYVPRLTVEADGTPEGKASQEAIDRVMLEGGQTEVGPGVRLDLDRLPPLMRDMLPLDSEATIVLSSPGVRLRWATRFTVDGATPPLSLDLDLVRAVPPDGWESSFSGTFAGFRIACHWRPKDPGSEIQWEWGWSIDRDAAVRDLLATIDFAIAMREHHLIVVDDRDGDRHRVDFETDAADTPDWMFAVKAVFADIVTVEEWTGREIRLPPDTLPNADVQAFREAARTIRTGVQVGVVTIGFTMTPEEADRYLSGAREVDVEATWQMNVFDMEIPLGKLVGKFASREAGKRRATGDGTFELYIESVGDARLRLERTPELDAPALEETG